MKNKTKIKIIGSPKPTGSRVAAQAIIHDAENMSARGAETIAKFFEKQARLLRSKKRVRLAKRFSAKYYYA